MKASLPLFPLISPRPPPLYSSRLLFSLGSGLWVEVSELSRKKQRHATGHALNVLAETFSSAANGRKEAEKQLIDNGSIITRTSAGAVSPVQDVALKADGPAEYEMSGYVNLGGPGFVQVATEDEQTGSQKNDATIHRTVEWPGWSDNPQQLFYFAVPVTVGGDGSEERVGLRLQFTPENKRMLMTTNIVVQTWTR